MNHKILPNGDLLLTAGNRDRSDLAVECRAGYYHAETAVADAFHEVLTFVRPKCIGALTNAPILTDDADDSDDSDDRSHAEYGGPVPHENANVWWFPDYAVRNPWEELSRTGKVVFTLARPTKEA